MAYEQKDNSGSLFKNDRKESDTHPDYKGSALLNGVDHWLDAWINTDRNGNKYMALKFKPKDAGGAHRVADTARSLPATSAPAATTSDSIPF
jgi:uncharacterized protein (DUF736 family)